jgi:hypothetical protein
MLSDIIFACRLPDTKSLLATEDETPFRENLSWYNSDYHGDRPASHQVWILANINVLFPGTDQSTTAIGHYDSYRIDHRMNAISVIK